MCRILLGLALAFLALPAWAQSQAGNSELCGNAINDPDVGIPACTALIQSGRETTAGLVADYANRGVAYSHKGDFDRDIADQTQAIQLDPSAVEPYNNRGNAYLGKGDYDRDIADEDRAIRINPNFARAYYNRGQGYGYKGDLDRDIADQTQAIQLAPNFAAAYDRRGEAYQAKHLRDLAIADYHAALKLDPNDQDSQADLKRLGVQ